MSLLHWIELENSIAAIVSKVVSSFEGKECDEHFLFGRQHFHSRHPFEAVSNHYGKVLFSMMI